MSQYEPGATAPPFHPWCRTTTAPHFDDLGEYERAARDKNGKPYYVPADMKYSEWKRKTIVEAAEKEYNVFKESVLETTTKVQENAEDILAEAEAINAKRKEKEAEDAKACEEACEDSCEESVEE